MLSNQIVVTGLLAYATYITAVCPCPKTNSCHKKQFFLSVGVAAGLVAYENGVLSVLR
jgi:hypothetical protein